MKVYAILLAVAVVAGCASSTSGLTEEQREQLYQQYIVQQQLAPARDIKNFKLRRWEALSEQSVLITSRGEDYLFTLQNRCSDIANASSVIVGRNSLIAQFSDRPATIGNPQLLPSQCLIKAIYPLTVAQATELRHLGKDE